jgi:hypothetical protein
MQELLVSIAGLRPPAFIMGGFAEDVLLGERLDRPHKDLDLLVRRDRLDALSAQLNSIGIGEWQVRLADATGQPLLLSGRAPLEDEGQAGGLEVEVYAASAEPDGGFSFEVPAEGPAGRRRLILPPDTFDYPAARLAGLSVHTLSPLALALMRAASAQTRHTGEKQARDLAMLARLRQTFLSGLSDQQLQPRIEDVAG